MKEFYAPTLEQIREMYDARTVQKVMPQVNNWRNASGLGSTGRSGRQIKRDKAEESTNNWFYLMSNVDVEGKLSAEAAAEVREHNQKLGRRTSEGDVKADDRKSKNSRFSKDKVVDAPALPRGNAMHATHTRRYDMVTDWW